MIAFTFFFFLYKTDESMMNKLNTDESPCDCCVEVETFRAINILMIYR